MDSLDFTNLAPGLYPGVPEEAYFGRFPGINSTTLKLMSRSPAHCRARMSGEGRRETAALALGKALHCAILEPDRFPSAYARQPLPEEHPGALVSLDDYKREAEALGLAKSGTKATLKEAILRTNPEAVFWEDLLPSLVAGRAVVSADNYAMCQAVLEAIAANPKARRALSGGDAELTGYWVDRETGVPCKLRMDYYRRDLGVVFDVKTTTDARPWAVARDIEKYDYHVSAAHYLDGLAALRQPANGFGWIFVEKEPPYAAGLFFASDDMLSRGREIFRMNLARFAECQASGQWPGYPAEFQTIDLPSWAA